MWAMAIASCLATCPAAWAQDEPSVEDVRAAGDEFNLGRTAFKDEDYSTAAEHFEKADSLAPNPKVLLLAIQSRERAGHAARAATLAALAQERYPEEQMFAGTRQLIVGALERLGKVKVTCERPCALLVDSRLVHGQPATTRFLFLDEGEYSIRAEFVGGQSDRKPVEARAGKSSKLQFSFVAGGSDATDSGAEPDDEVDWGAQTDDGLPKGQITHDEVATVDVNDDSARSGLSPTVFWIGVGLTAASAGVSTWSGLDAQNNPGRDAVQRECQGLGTDCEAWKDGKAAELRTNVLWGVTAGVGLTTILIGAIWTDWGAPEYGLEQTTHRRKLRSATIEPWIDVASAVSGTPALGAKGRF